MPIRLLLIVVVALITASQPDPTPRINIPTGTPAPTFTFDHLLFQEGDLPSSFILVGVETFDVVQDFPEPLAALYQTYNVIGGVNSRAFVEDCVNQPIYGIELWIRQTQSPVNAELLLADPNLPAAYQQALGWETLELADFPGGNDYRAVGSICDEPNTRYIVEYALDEYIIAISVHALNTTSIDLVQSVLDELITFLNSRTPPDSESPTLTTTIAVNVRSGAGTQYTIIGALREGETVEILATNADKTWWQIRYFTRRGWIFAALAEVNGDTAALPVMDGEGIVQRNFSRSQPTTTPQPPPPSNDCVLCFRYQPGHQGEAPPAATQSPGATTEPQPTPTPCIPPICGLTPPFVTPQNP